MNSTYCLCLLVLLQLCISYGNAALPLPSYVTACSQKDPKLNECALREGRKALPFIVKGDKKYKIPELDPLKIEKLSVEAGLIFTATDVDILGLKDATLEKVELYLDGDKKRAVVEAHGARFEILAKYEVKGKILVVPLTGKGDANITLLDADLKYATDFHLVKKDDGEEYIEFIDKTFDFDCKGLKIHLDNLFNGDKTLGDNMNKFLNENWQEVKLEMGPPIAEALSQVLKLILDRIIGNVPYKEIIKQ